MRYICTSKPVGLAQTFSTGNVFSTVNFLYGALLELDAFSSVANNITHQLFCIIRLDEQRSNWVRKDAVGRESAAYPASRAKRGIFGRRPDRTVEYASLFRPTF
jgi:hypothetical protein